MDSEQVPTQVRIRTDPEDGHAVRYREIQRAKNVFDAGNNTEAVVAACRHARLDKKAKGDALAYLAQHVSPQVLAGVVERLDTATMPLEVETTTTVERSTISVSVHDEETAHHVNVGD